MRYFTAFYGDMMDRIWKNYRGVIVTLLTLSAIELLALIIFRIPNPPPLLMLTIIFAAYIGSMREGFVSAAITWVYTLYYFSLPGRLFHYTDDSLQRIMVLTFVIPATALLVGILKRRADNSEYNRVLFEKSAIGLALCRMDGSLVDANEAYARIIGRTVEETLKLSYWDITPKKYAEQEQAQLEALNATSRYGPYEKEYIHKDGRLVTVRLQGLLIKKNGESLIWSSVEDISERKQTENILVSEKQLLEMISQGAALPAALEKIVLSIEELSHETIASILLLDHDGLRMHYGAAPHLPGAYNRALEGAAIGPSAGSCGTAAYRRALVIVSDIETDPLWADYRELARTNGLRACWSTPIMGSEGSVLGTFAMYYREPRSPREEDFDLIARATHIASIAIESSQAETALREKEHFLSESQRIAHIGSWIYDVTGRITWSDEMYRIYGVSPDTVTPNAKVFINLIHPDDRPAMQIWITSCLAGEKPDDLEFRAILPDGKVRFINGRGELISDADNRPAYMAGTAQDITERKRAEEEIRKLNKELEQRVKDRTAELETKVAEIERMNKLFVGRELRMMELKEKVKELESRIQNTVVRSQK